MRVLLDTCVLSELYKKKPSILVWEAVEALPDDNLYLSVITLGEIGKGISLLPDSHKKQELNIWYNQIEHVYVERILSVDPETASIWGKLTASAQKNGKVLPMADGLIAATALRHGLHLMTRNVKDFEITGVLLLNPWNDLK